MEGADRISALPEEIKVSILCRLEVKDAVRTSALARSWHHLWTLLPSLRVSCCGDRLGDTSYHYDIASGWIERVHHLVSSLRGLLHFELCHHFGADHSPLLQSLLDLLLQKGVSETLFFFNDFHPNPAVIHLPPFNSLKVLNFSDVISSFLLVSYSKLNCLTKLSLRFVRISSDDLHLLIHTANNLAAFHGKFFEATEHPLSVNINAPFLRRLKFDIDKSVEKVVVISAPCLEYAYIASDFKYTAYSLEKLAQVTLGLLTSVATVSSLHLDSYVLKSFSLVPLPSNLMFSKLRCVKLNMNVIKMHKRIYDVFVWLLRRMPFLEELELKMMSDLSMKDKVAILMRELFVKKPDGLSCFNQTLKSVTLIVNDVIIGIIVAKFFLLHANVLKIMKIRYWTFSDVEPGLIEELQEAEITSSDAKVVISYGDFHVIETIINVK